MNVDKLRRLQAQVRIGGKGTPRRKKKVVHQTAATDDKKLQSSLKKLSVSTIPGIEEVNIIKDDLTVIHFNNPKAQASLSANTFAITGHGETKKIVEMLPEILPQLGQDTVMQLRMFANNMTGGQKFAPSRLTKLAEEDEEVADDEVPMLVSDFEEVAKRAEEASKLVVEKQKGEVSNAALKEPVSTVDTKNKTPVQESVVEVAKAMGKQAAPTTSVGDGKNAPKEDKTGGKQSNKSASESTAKNKTVPDVKLEKPEAKSSLSVGAVDKPEKKSMKVDKSINLAEKVEQRKDSEGKNDKKLPTSPEVTAKQLQQPPQQQQPKEQTPQKQQRPKEIAPQNQQKQHPKEQSSGNQQKTEQPKEQSNESKQKPHQPKEQSSENKQKSQKTKEQSNENTQKQHQLMEQAKGVQPQQQQPKEPSNESKQKPQQPMEHAKGSQQNQQALKEHLKEGPQKQQLEKQLPEKLQQTQQSQQQLGDKSAQQKQHMQQHQPKQQVQPEAKQLQKTQEVMKKEDLPQESPSKMVEIKKPNELASKETEARKEVVSGTQAKQLARVDEQKAAQQNKDHVNKVKEIVPEQNDPPKKLEEGNKSKPEDKSVLKPAVQPHPKKEESKQPQEKMAKPMEQPQKPSNLDNLLNEGREFLLILNKYCSLS